MFQDIQQAGDLSDNWREDYNENHPHGSMGGKSPRKNLKTELEQNNKHILGKMSKITASKKRVRLHYYKSCRKYDILGTWRSPCVEKIPKMFALQEEFKDQNQLKFLFVSIDKDLDKWRNYISKLPAEGLHINAGRTGIFQDYMMGGIPHYIIIDASGNIYQSNAPDPDSREIKDMLEELIERSNLMKLDIN